MTDDDGGPGRDHDGGSHHDDGRGPGVARTRLRQATARLDGAGIESAAHDARLLLAHLLGQDRLDLAGDGGLTAEQAAAFDEAVARRVRREPLQHILGETGFRYLTLEVRPGVFVPRPETELVAQAAIDEVARLCAGGATDVVVVDLCTGSGAIALAVATEQPAATVLGVDVSRRAVALATANAARAGAGNVRFQYGDVRRPGTVSRLAGKVDVVVANPPYIPPGAVPRDPEVRDWDPPGALYGGGPDGLALPAAVTVTAARLLRPGGLFVMEHGDLQGPAMRWLVQARGFADPATLLDLAERPRMVVARRAADPG